MKRIAWLIASAVSLAIAGLSHGDDVVLHSWGVEFVGSDGVTTERDMIVVDPWEFDLAIDAALDDPPTETPEPDIWDCLDAARAACPNGVKRFYFSAGPPAVCEFECFPSTGGGS